MTLFEYLEVTMLFLAAAGGVAAPAIGIMMTSHHRSRERRLDHIDECIDDLKRLVLGTAVTRAELDRRMIEMRDAVSADTHGLHERIMRLGG